MSLDNQTLMMPIHFTAYGIPKPAGSKCAFGFKRKDGSAIESSKE